MQPVSFEGPISLKVCNTPLLQRLSYVLMFGLLLLLLRGGILTCQKALTTCVTTSVAGVGFPLAGVIRS